MLSCVLKWIHCLGMEPDHTSVAVLPQEIPKPKNKKKSAKSIQDVMGVYKAHKDCPVQSLCPPWVITNVHDGTCIICFDSTNTTIPCCEEFMCPRCINIWDKYSDYKTCPLCTEDWPFYYNGKVINV